MTLRDGRPVVQIVYAGNGFAHAKLWITMKNRARGYTKWETIGVDLLPDDFLHDMRGAADRQLQRAA